MDDKPSIDVPEALGEEIGGPGKAYFDDVVIDNILDALLELSAAVWTYHDRVNVLETILAQKGIEVGEAIEDHVPDADEIARREKERMALVNRVFGSFLRRPTPRGPGALSGNPATGDDT